MRLPNLPWWLNPWAEVRRLRDEAFTKALSHGAEIRALRAEVEKQTRLAEKAADSLFEVQSYSAGQLRTLRIERDNALQREKVWLVKVLEIANMMPPPIQFIRKED